MRVYWLGCRFGWRDVTSAASKYSCYDLLCDDKQSIPGQVDVKDLLHLMKFHKDRKERMKVHLFGDIESIHARINPYRCSLMAFNVEYRYFVSRLLEEMDHTPPAGRISGAKLYFFSEDAHMTECKCCSCHYTLSRQDVINRVESHWAELRQTLML